MYKAFQGPNGWYVAWQDKDGFHYQPALGGTLAERSAKARADELSFEEQHNYEGDYA